MRSKSWQGVFGLIVFFQSAWVKAEVEYLPENQHSPKATIEELSWLAGTWQGEIWDGQFEEIWSSPSAGSMMASFKFSHNNQVQFYELITIVQQQGSLVLRLKHFDPELKGWEEKHQSLSFSLVRLAKNAAYFEGYTFKMISPNQLHVFVVTDKQGKSKTSQFIFNRKLD